jgi:hypothetical protein
MPARNTPIVQPAGVGAATARTPGVRPIVADGPIPGTEASSLEASADTGQDADPTAHTSEFDPTATP